MELLLNWTEQHPSGLLTAFFLVSFIESLALVGWVVPGVAILFSFGLIAGSAETPLLQVLTVAALGGFLGDLASFTLGKQLQSSIYKLPGFRNHPEWYSQGEQFFKKYGLYSIPLGRFIGPLRPIIPLLAGALGVPRRTFIFIGICISIPWAAVYCIPGYWAGQTLDSPFQSPRGYLSLIGVLLTAEVIYQLLRYLLAHSGKKTQSLFVISSIILILLTSIVLKINGYFSWLDISFFNFTQTIQVTSISTILTLFSLSADSTMLTIYMLVLLFYSRASNWQHIKQILFIPCCFIAIYLTLSIVLDSPTPAHLTTILNDASSRPNSLPAGHTFFAMLLAGHLLRLNYRTSIPSGTNALSRFVFNGRAIIYWATLVGAAGVYVQTHCLTDILFSLVLGILCTLITQHLYPIELKTPQKKIKRIRAIILILLIFFFYTSFHLNLMLK